MPRNIDLPSEIRRTQRLVDNNDITKTQIVCRLTPATYLRHLTNCTRRGIVAGPLAAEILSDYYQSWSKGIHLTLSDHVRGILDQIARVCGVDREFVVLAILDKFAGHVLAETVKTQRQQQETIVQSQELLAVNRLRLSENSLTSTATIS